MKFNKQGITDWRTLTEPEARAYILFLESERKRHLKDVIDIDKRIAQVNKKFNKEG